METALCVSSSALLNLAGSAQVVTASMGGWLPLVTASTPIVPDGPLLLEEHWFLSMLWICLKIRETLFPKRDSAARLKGDCYQSRLHQLTSFM